LHVSIIACDACPLDCAVALPGAESDNGIGSVMPGRAIHSTAELEEQEDPQ
jgi:hypothetical protein